MRKKSKKQQWLEVMQYRRELTVIERKDLVRLTKGFAGERRMDQLVAEFLGGKVVVLDDLTIEYQGTLVQIDKIIITATTIFVIDMKNYSGKYIFRDNNWYCGNQLLTSNILEQLRRAVRAIVGILRDHRIYLQVTGVLAFVGLEATVSVESPITEIVLQYGDIARWLYQLNQNQSFWEYPNCEEVIRNYQVESYPCEFKADLAELKPGICCPKCHQMNMVEHWYKLSCSCGHLEAKKIGYLRTVSEYGVIFHDKDIRRKDLRIFFGPQVNDRYLKRLLAEYFHLNKKKSKASGYLNRGISFEYLFEDKKEEFERMKLRVNWKERKR